MLQTHSTSFPPALCVQALPGTWKLDHGRALTLKPRVDALLRAAHGGLWVTFSAPPSLMGQASGDVFIAAGESITIPAGSTAVIEPWQRHALAPAPSYFSWDATACALATPVRPASHWQLGVLQPLADMRDGLIQVGHAFGALLLGLGGVLGMSMGSLMPARRMRKA